MYTYKRGWSFLIPVLLAAVMFFGGTALSVSCAEESATGVFFRPGLKILTDPNTNEDCLVNADGEVLIPYTSDGFELHLVGQDLYVVFRSSVVNGTRNASYALCDSQRFITGFDYGYIDFYYIGDEPRMADTQEHLTGYIDCNGQWVIEPRWHWANAFSEGLALVGNENPGEFGYINTKGEYEIRFLSNSLNNPGAGDFSEGKAEFQEANGLWGYRDRKWNVVIDPVYLDTSPFSCGFAAVEDETGCYHIDHNGQPLYDERYKWADDFVYGYATVRKGYKQEGLISSDGSLVYPATAYRIMQITPDELCWIRESEKQKGLRLFDIKTGSFLTTESYQIPFKGGFIWNDEGFVVKKDGLSGFLSKSGQLLVPCEYDFLTLDDNNVLCGYIGDAPLAPVPIPQSEVEDNN